MDNEWIDKHKHVDAVCVCVCVCVQYVLTGDDGCVLVLGLGHGHGMCVRGDCVWERYDLDVLLCWQHKHLCYFTCSLSIWFKGVAFCHHVCSKYV